VDPARVCQQESRSVSIAHAGPGPQTVPDAYTFPDDAPRPVPAASATSSTQWSRPIGIDVCSMFAPTPRYGPAPPGIRSEARMPATGQNDSSRHVLAWLESSSRRINEQSSGLLIRGFGVLMLARCLLGGRMVGQGRLVKNAGDWSRPIVRTLPVQLHRPIAVGTTRCPGCRSLAFPMTVRLHPSSRLDPALTRLPSTRHTFQ
jgi:hypothetical protein